MNQSRVLTDEYTLLSESYSPIDDSRTKSVEPFFSSMSLPFCAEARARHVHRIGPAKVGKVESIVESIEIAVPLVRLILIRGVQLEGHSVGRRRVRQCYIQSLWYRFAIFAKISLRTKTLFLNKETLC